MPTKLTPQALDAALPTVPEWSVDGHELLREFTFDDFVEAFRFVSGVALLAEKHQHHPWWSNVYNRVEIRLTTHDVGNAISGADIELARAIDALL